MPGPTLEAFKVAPKRVFMPQESVVDPGTR